VFPKPPCCGNGSTPAKFRRLTTPRGGKRGIRVTAGCVLPLADYLLDTSFLIDYFNEVADGRVGPARRFRATLPGASRLCASIVSLAELIEGAGDATAVERELLRLARVVGLHHHHGTRAGLMQQRARTRGTRMGENDAWIAATAALAQLTIIGDDDRAFANRPSVDYVNFRAALVQRGSPTGQPVTR